TGKVDGGPGQRAADPALAEAGPGDEAGDRPDAVVCLVFAASAPGNAHANQPKICGTRLDRAPADWFTVEVRDKPARLFVAVIASGLLAQPLPQVIDRHRLPIGIPDSEPLA